MSSTFTIRIPKELREQMRRLPVEWSGEVRRFIENRVRQLELAEVIRSVRVRAELRRVSTDSVSLIREDRER
ncbi:MAG: VapB-type antitoxin [Candidatus Bathyarchaeia archaeon]